jgi:valyl-tRNA synthetase
MTFVDRPLSKEGGARSTSRFDVHLVYERKIDVGAERTRLRIELDQFEKQIANKERQLGNEQFLSKAPAQVVAGLRTGLDELKILREKMQRQLEELR